MLNHKIIVGKNGNAGIWEASSIPSYENPQQWARFSRAEFDCDDSDVHTLDGVATPDAPHGGVWYSEDLAGRDGMAFTLFQEEGKHTVSDIAEAKRWLRNRRDVVVFYVIRVKFPDKASQEFARDSGNRVPGDGNGDRPFWTG